MEGRSSTWRSISPAAEEEFGSGTIDAAAIASPESLEEFFEKEWVRSLFALAVEDLRALCAERERDRAFQLFETYDLEGDDKLSYAQLAQQHGIAVTRGNQRARLGPPRVSQDCARTFAGNLRQ